MALTVRTLAARLTQYDEHEAQSIVRLVLADCFGFSLTDICCGALDNLSPENSMRLDELMRRLEEGEPVQYVTGKAMFCGREFAVRPGCLIPRPETEELCQWIVDETLRYEDENEMLRYENEGEDENEDGKIRILDIGTGSGCIAITLALDIKDSKVTAWDISSDALAIAKDNADALHADVDFEIRDALNLSVEKGNSNSLPNGEGWGRASIIVSNPPYICNKEAQDMEQNVLGHEPHLALFVPDDDPLLFYRKIAEYAVQTLTPNGALYFEINPLYVTQLSEMLRRTGFQDIETRTDAFGKQRMVKATL